MTDTSELDFPESSELMPESLDLTETSELEEFVEELSVFDWVESLLRLLKIVFCELEHIPRYSNSPWNNRYRIIKLFLKMEI